MPPLQTTVEKALRKRLAVAFWRAARRGRPHKAGRMATGIARHRPAISIDAKPPRHHGADRGPARRALSTDHSVRLRVRQIEQDVGVAWLVGSTPAGEVMAAQLLQPVQHHSAQLEEGNRVRQVIRGSQFHHLLGGHAALEPAPMQLDGLLPTMNADRKWIAEQARAATIDRSRRLSPTRSAPHLDSLWHRNPCVHAPSPNYVSPRNLLSTQDKDLRDQ